MKKIVLCLFLLFSFPLIIFADINDLKPTDLEASFKEENISYDLSNYNSGEEKVNIYLFRGLGCGHCHDFLEFVSDTLVKEYGDYFNFVSYEVWHNKANSELMNKVMNHFNITKGGVPFIVIDDKFFIGFGSSSGESIINVLKEEFNNSERKDIVKSIIDGNEIINKEETPSENNNNFNNENTKKPDVVVSQNEKVVYNYDIKELLLMGFVIVVCISILVVLFIVFGPKRKDKSSVDKK